MNRRGLEPVKRVAYFEYDFARDGGAVGDITLRGDSLPAGAVVNTGMVHVISAVTSDGLATVALKLESAEDVLAATAKASLTTGALIHTVPVDTAATSVLIAASGTQVVATVAEAALTAGKIVVAVEYY